MRNRMVGAVIVLIIAALTIAAPNAAAAPVTQPYVGMTVCKNGSITGFTCGFVTAVNATVCYTQGCIYGLARTNMYAVQGDQGAPVYYNRELIGYVVAIGGGSTYFDPI